ncbi:hypothetical protein [Hafnia psychrotolerans]|nr:hypothetical protein [Hafnia psychrotolerans]
MSSIPAAIRPTNVLSQRNGLGGNGRNARPGMVFRFTGMGGLEY